MSDHEPSLRVEQTQRHLAAACFAPLNRYAALSVIAAIAMTTGSLALFAVSAANTERLVEDAFKTALTSERHRATSTPKTASGIDSGRYASRPSAQKNISAGEDYWLGHTQFSKPADPTSPQLSAAAWTTAPSIGETISITMGKAHRTLVIVDVREIPSDLLEGASGIFSENPKSGHLVVITGRDISPGTSAGKFVRFVLDGDNGNAQGDTRLIPQHAL